MKDKKLSHHFNRFDSKLYNFCCAINCPYRIYNSLRNSKDNLYGCVTHEEEYWRDCYYLTSRGNLKNSSNVKEEIKLRTICAWKKFVEIKDDKT